MDVFNDVLGDERTSTFINWPPVHVDLKNDCSLGGQPIPVMSYPYFQNIYGEFRR